MRRFLVLAGVLTLFAPVAAYAQYGGDTGAVTIDDSTPDPGGEISFNIAPGTFLGGSSGDIFRLSEPVNVGTFTVQGDGSASGKVTIPADTEPGAHTLEFRGTGPDGQPKTVSVTLSVGGETLAATGASDVGDMLRTAGLVLIVGLALVGLAVQRQRARVAKMAARETAGV